MKKLTFLLAAIVFLLSSCSKDSEGLENLLRHVPADATMVAGFNMKSTLEKSGCKVDGSKVVLSDEMKKALSNNLNMSDVLNLFSTVDAGVKIDWIGVFMMGGKTYILGPIDNEKRFRAYIEKLESTSFTKSGNVEKAGNWIIADGYFWTSISPILADRVEDFASLPESKSWLSKKYAGKLCEEADDGFVVCDVAGISSLLGSSTQAQLVTMGAGMMFNDLSYIALNIELKKDAVEIEADMLNSNFARADYLLPKVAVDTSLISKVAKNADVVIALSVPAALVEKFDSLLKLAGDETAAITAIDGTVVAASIGDEGTGVVQLTNPSAAEGMKKMLTAALGREVNGTMTGNDLFFTFTDATSAPGTPIESPASYFNKALAGFLANAANAGVPEGGYISVMLLPEDNSVELKCVIKTVENPFLFIINGRAGGDDEF